MAQNFEQEQGRKVFQTSMSPFYYRYHMFSLLFQPELCYDAAG